MKVQWWIIKVILLENDRLLLENLSLDVYPLSHPATIKAPWTFTSPTV